MSKIVNIVTAAVVAITLTLTGCQEKPKAVNVIKVGTISGPETQLMTVAKAVAQKRYGLDVEVVEFSDYTMPNAALNDGSIDANMFQHKPYLDAAIKAKQYPIVAVAKTFIYPMGIYSNKIKNIKEIKPHATIAIPNDPSNEARALLLLSKAGLITLTANAGATATLANIKSNPKKLHFKELDAAQLPRVLPDVTAAVINTNYAVPAGLNPDKDSIFLEDKKSPYANLVVVKIVDRNNPNVKKLIDALHSPEVIEESHTLFQGGALPAW